MGMKEYLKQFDTVIQEYYAANLNNQQVYTKLIVYLEPKTGIPVLEEVFQERNGKVELIWSEELSKYIN